jgi:peptide-methionine (S)-S-oxide reductase
MTKEDTFGKPIVTKISAASKFYVAEDYHKNYYNDNKSRAIVPI